MSKYIEAIKYKNNSLEIVDQLLLPKEYKLIQIKTVEDAWTAIKKMQVRGAPAIAIVACLSLAIELTSKLFNTKIELFNEIKNKLNYILTSRPTAVNLKNAVDHLLDVSQKLNLNNKINPDDMKSNIIFVIESMLTKDIADNINIGINGGEAILQKCNIDKLRILTHCNTGALATSAYGTALGVIRSLHSKNKLDHVFFTETRPYNQGARLTAYELLHDNIPSTLITDSMVGVLMKEKKISAVIVGADRIVRNGDTANKIGTYQIAVLANYHKIPFYVAAPFTSIDPKILCGDEIIIEERPSKEMIFVGDHQIAPDDVKCWNPAFDVTPFPLITGIITEKGVFSPENLTNEIDNNSK